MLWDDTIAEGLELFFPGEWDACDPPFGDAHHPFDKLCGQTVLAVTPINRRRFRGLPPELPLPPFDGRGMTTPTRLRFGYSLCGYGQWLPHAVAVDGAGPDDFTPSVPRFDFFTVISY